MKEDFTLQNRTYVLIIKYNVFGDDNVVKIINPDMPEEFQNETDYRNIPREYLNPRIPQGRGMIKWAPFIIYTIFFKKLLYPINVHNLYVQCVCLY